MKIGTAMCGCRSGFAIFGIEILDPKRFKGLTQKAATTSESDSHAAADGAGGLHQVNGLAILPHHGHIALRQQIAQIDEHFHVGGQEAEGGDRLAKGEVKAGFPLAWGGGKTIYPTKGLTTF